MRLHILWLKLRNYFTRKDITVIPYGAYCYDNDKACPYFRRYKNKKAGEFAGCLFWNIYDDVCLNDMCKICGFLLWEE